MFLALLLLFPRHTIWTRHLFVCSVRFFNFAGSSVYRLHSTNCLIPLSTATSLWVEFKARVPLGPVTSKGNMNQIAIPFPRHKWSLPLCLLLFLFSRSVVSDSVTPWTISPPSPLSMVFSRQEYWSQLPYPSSGDIPHPGIRLRSPSLQVDSLPSGLSGKPHV